MQGAAGFKPGSKSLVEKPLFFPDLYVQNTVLLYMYLFKQR